MGLCIIGAKDIAEYMQWKNAELIDLREPQEYRQFHISGAYNVPAEQLSDYMKGQSKEQILIFYCQHGSISIQEGKRYARAGYHVCTLAGGIQAYQQIFDGHEP